jgi:hypothetical protein
LTETIVIRRFLLSILIAAAAATPLAAQQVTVTSGPISTDVGPVGNDVDLGSIPTVLAQTFTPVGGFNYVQSFQFFMSQGFGSGGSSLALQANIYAFDTDHLVGSGLFSPIDFFGTDAVTEQSVSIGSSEHPLNWFVAPGQTYALVLSTINGGPPPDHATITVAATDASFLGGSLFYSMVTDPGHLTDVGAFADAGDAFGSGPGSLEAAGSATFSKTRVVGTPEPSTIVMLATGLIPIGAVVRRRRRRVV